MTYETYLSLKRANEKRKKSASRTGNWKVVEECCKKEVLLDAEYAQTISPDPPGHPDNPIFI